MEFVAKQQSPVRITLPVFEGPLDLLLHLIKEHEVDIYDIPIAQVTEQYLQYLALMESLDLDVAGEFLVMAATLMEIKSKMLLPPDPKEDGDEDEAIDPRQELVERLIEYQRFKEAADFFRDLEGERQKLFLRGMTEMEQYYETPTLVLKNISSIDLLEALRRMLADVGEGEAEVTSIQGRRITVRMRMSEVWRKVSIQAGQCVLFEELFSEDKSRQDIVITFLAILELLRLGRIGVKQERVFDNIEIFSKEDTQETNGEPDNDE